MLKKSTAAFMIVAALLCGSLLTLGVTGYVQVFGQAAGEGLAASVRPTGGLEDKESQKLGTALSLIEGNYYETVDREKLIDGAVNGMMEALGDPYSNYMGKETAEVRGEYRRLLLGNRCGSFLRQRQGSGGVPD